MVTQQGGPIEKRLNYQGVRFAEYTAAALAVASERLTEALEALTNGQAHLRNLRWMGTGQAASENDEQGAVEWLCRQLFGEKKEPR